MANSAVSALLVAFTAALTVEDAIPASACKTANDIRMIIEVLRQMTHEAIEVALATPGDAFERVELLRQAVTFDGCDSPLVGRCAVALAEASNPPAILTAA